MKKGKLIVIGDFFIDENWLMAKTENYHSTDVGDIHYNSLVKDTKSNVMSVCGVANVLKVLSGKKNNKINSQYDILGVGAWNHKDTDLLNGILSSNREYYMTPYTLENNIKEIYDKANSNLEYDLLNLVPEENDNISTNRIYRIYEGFGSDQPKLRYRLDWRMDLNENSLNYDILDNINDVKAIVIVDHGKGVITKTLIQKLLEKFKDADWYVRAKLMDTPWMRFIKENGKHLRLIVVDQQIINYKYGIRIWKRSESLCRASLELIGDMLGLKTYKHSELCDSSMINSDNVAILFYDNWAIAGSRFNSNDAKICYLPRLSEDNMIIRVGRTSIFFNSLVYWDLVGKSNDHSIKKPIDDESIDEATEWALGNVNEWMKKCTEAWKDEKPSGLSGPFEQVVSWQLTNDVKVREGAIYNDYNNSWKEWHQSSIKKGLLDCKDEDSNKNKLVKNIKKIDKDKLFKEFHLWRSYGTLPNYVCPGGEKRSKINSLVHSLYEFSKNDHPTLPFNCLLVAEPGWGKSYLAQCLSEYFDFDFLNYSIAQMASTKELIDSLKEIASTQKRSKKKILVFMDEIDAKINGETTLGLLLSPMWGGKFKSEGYTNEINPIIWIFACTKPLQSIRELTKGRDFLSRINGPKINLDFLEDVSREEIHNIQDEDKRNEKLKAHLRNITDYKDDKRTEIVYQVVNLLNIQYGPISGIDTDVLNLFYHILPVNGVRSLQIFVSKFKNITKGIIKKHNVPYPREGKELEREGKELKEHIVLLEEQEMHDLFKDDKLGQEAEIIRIKL